MKYLRTFLNFWRKFIIGDDARIAIVVMWTLLLLKSLTSNVLNEWYILPIVVMVLLTAIVYGNSIDHHMYKKTTTTFRVFVSITIPMIIVMAIPLLLFRYINSETDLHQTFVPFSIFILIAMIVSGVMGQLYAKFPVMSIFISGVISYLFVLPLQPSVIQLSTYLSAHYQLASTFLALAIPIFFVTYIVTAFRHAEDKRI